MSKKKNTHTLHPNSFYSHLTLQTSAMKKSVYTDNAEKKNKIERSKDV